MAEVHLNCPIRLLRDEKIPTDVEKVVSEQMMSGGGGAIASRTGKESDHCIINKNTELAIGMTFVLCT